MKKINRFNLLFLLFIFAMNACLATPNDRVYALPGFGKVQQSQYAGYADAGQQQKIFYWFVSADKNPEQSPIIIWTSGGPGTSSLYGFFLENGPYVLHQVDKKFYLTDSKFGWNHLANYLIFDQPVGIGLSFADKNDYPKTPEQGTEQFYQALSHFLLAHPAFRHSPIYLSGESYAGTYIALLSKRILQQNQRHPDNRINLKGVIIVSGWVDPVIQESSDAEFAFYHGLISRYQKQKIDTLYRQCKNTDKMDGDSSAATNQACSKIGDAIRGMTHIPDMHDIGNPGIISETAMVNYLNDPVVRRDIHASTAGTYQTMTNIWDGYSSHEQDSYDAIYSELLKAGIPLLVFSGLEDASDCNPLGTERWLYQLDFKEKSAFWSESPVPWYLGSTGIVLGYMQHAGGLTWVKVLHASHLVPISQPRITSILQCFIYNNATIENCNVY